MSACWLFGSICEDVAADAFGLARFVEQPVPLGFRQGAGDAVVRNRFAART